MVGIGAWRFDGCATQGGLKLFKEPLEINSWANGPALKMEWSSALDMWQPTFSGVNWKATH